MQKDYQYRNTIFPLQQTSVNKDLEETKIRILFSKKSTKSVY